MKLMVLMRIRSPLSTSKLTLTAPPDDGVALHLGGYDGIYEALVDIVALDDVGRSLGDILGIFVAAAEAEAFIEVLLLAAPHTGVCPAQHAGTLHDGDLEPGGVTSRREAVDADGDILEVPLAPDAVDDGRNVVSRDGEGQSLLHSGSRDDLLVAVVVVSFHPDPGDHELPRVVVVDYDVLPFLATCRKRREH